MERTLTVVELQTALAAMDVVCTPYPAHIGSSSIVLRAAAAGRPVVGSDTGWVGETVRRFSLGRVCDVRAPGALARALADALDATSSYAMTDAARRLVAYHTVENYQAHWTARLRERLGWRRCL
jgi:glycosyltransferase involved in cell wall biosynthesis